LPAGQPLTVARLANQPRAICRRAIWWWLNLNDILDNLNLRALETLLDAVTQAEPGRWSAGPGRWLVLDGAALSVAGGAKPGAESSWGPLNLKAGQTLSLPSGAKLTAKTVIVDRKLLKVLKSGKTDPSQNAYLALSAKSKEPAFIVRSWQPGDRYRPLGAPGRRKLQDLFMDKKIPLKERHRLPVVCTEDNEPLWVPGLPPAHSAKVVEASRTALGLTYQA
jgi:tRNA(Ile)-lysidine synthase